MYSYIKKIEEKLTDNDKRQLNDIYKPTVVAVPDEDAWHGLCVTRDGNIRFYGNYNKKNVFDTACEKCYIESADGGLSWKKYIITDKNTLGSGTYVPFLDKYMNVRYISGEGTFVFSGTSHDDTSPEKIKIFDADDFMTDFRLPFVMTSQNRIIVVAHENRPKEHETCYYPLLLISDDGKNWSKIALPAVPYMEKKWPHKGYRWQQNNRENTIEELSDGTLLMMTRTATDFHYTATSKDGGYTWSEFEPSIFHSTGTMPYLKKLDDGRILFFWCNTKLLPELADADGIWEDVFTNRDANHCAISSDDGKTWGGYREIALNSIRHAVDFRANGGIKETRDKSVHQFEALQLPMNKMLVVYGQNRVSSRIVIFDLNWLYETTRKEDFICGLENLSAQSYVKSILGGFRGSPETALSYTGHCAYNRITGAMLLPSPEDNGKEALHIASNPDSRLVSPICGAVWNFPIAKKGKVTISAYMPENSNGLRVSLLDYWMNPSDDTVQYYADFSIVLRPDMHTDGQVFADFVFEFDCEKGTVSISSGDYLYLEKRLDGTHPSGLCYLHMQSVTKTDEIGAFIKEIKFEKIN